MSKVAPADGIGSSDINADHSGSSLIKGIGDRLADAARGPRHHCATTLEKRRNLKFGGRSHCLPFPKRLLNRHGKLLLADFVARSLFGHCRVANSADGHGLRPPADKIPPRNSLDLPGQPARSTWKSGTPYDRKTGLTEPAASAADRKRHWCHRRSLCRFESA